MKKTLLATLLMACVVAISPAQADTDADAIFIADLIVAQQFDQALDGMRNQMPIMRKQIMESVLNNAPGDSEKARTFTEKIEPLQQRLMERYIEDLRKPEVRAQLTQIAALSLKRVLSPEELTSLAAYYRTPLGASIAMKQGKVGVDMMPAVMEITTRELQPAMKDFMTEVSQLIDQEKSEKK